MIARKKDIEWGAHERNYFKGNYSPWFNGMHIEFTKIVV